MARPIHDWPVGVPDMSSFTLYRDSGTSLHSAFWVRAYEHGDAAREISQRVLSLV